MFRQGPTGVMTDFLDRPAASSIDQVRPTTRKDASHLRGQTRSTLIALFCVLGLIAVCIAIADQYQLVYLTSLDVLIVGLIALFGGVIRRLFLSVKKRKVFAGGSAVISQKDLFVLAILTLLTTGTLLLLNACLDRDPPTLIDATLTAKRCNRGCRWLLDPVRDVPGFENVIVVEVAGKKYRASQVGDLVELKVKPGFFRRPWIQSYTVLLVNLGQFLKALDQKDTRDLRILVDQGYPIDGVIPREIVGDDDKTVLMAAASAHDRSAVAFLVSCGADVNRATRTGKTALMSAVLSGDAEIVRMLLKSGADPSAKTQYQHYGDQVSSVMGLALELGDSTIIRLVADAINRR